MIRRKLSVVCALLVIAVVAGSAQGQSCEQGGTVLCGPICGVYYDIIYDGSFTEGGCNWYLDSPTYATWGSFCGQNVAFAKFPYTGGQQVAISQTTTALPANAGYGSKFSFQYEYAINDPNNNSANAIDVRIMQPNGYWYFVDQPAGGSQSCQSRTIDLGSHPEWAGQLLTIVIFGTVANSNASISVDNVVMFQHP